MEITPLRELVFAFSAREDLKRFPRRVQSACGYALHSIQVGETPSQAKAMKGFGSGATVMELRLDERGDTYRAVYTTKIGDAVYVLHCFQKKAKSGIATPRQEIKTIEARLRWAQADARQKEKQR